ncbi:MAG: hypothetical protein LBR58_11660 [Propionibacteriaceae bacterium]|nr:hypothetical protein [Propionibacteriaceae bacterium]
MATLLCATNGVPSDDFYIPMGTLMVIFGVFWWWFVGQFMRGGVEDDPAPNVVAGSTQSNTGSQQPRQAEAVPVPLWHADVKAALRDAGYEAVQIDQALDHLPADADELTALKMALQQLGKR